ncbi:YbaK/aminoacyl-tRNA synthetase-associated domain [Melia azedarach]|uniref:YbaK/aminoacyl-tRNA synthetase-associated domain n=1 Tax=Melia azedarach TaxID=155640 RepID=A0ACC1XQ17_MELAZ|nr:YbaK/aminoacyl-tRNA synthetase-associated domain [Melia azedarach]
MEAALAELEQVQTQILERISKLELTHLSQNDDVSATATVPASTTRTICDTEARLSNILRSNGVNGVLFKKVPADYYDWPLESRRDVLSAASVHHLCKSIVLVNTQAQSNVVDCSDRNNSKYYVVVVQYTARFNAETVKNFLYSLNNGKIPKKKFNLRLAPEETSVNLTGYEHNAVTCIGMKTDIPVILDEAITKLNPDFFWLGGGEIDLKLGIRTSEFIKFVKPFIVSCS